MSRGLLHRVCLMLLGALALAAPAQAGYIHLAIPEVDPSGCGSAMGPPRLEAPLTINLDEASEILPDEEVLLQLLAPAHFLALHPEGATTSSPGCSSGPAPAPVASLSHYSEVLTPTLHGVILPGQGPTHLDPLPSSLFHPPRLPAHSLSVARCPSTVARGR